MATLKYLKVGRCSKIVSDAARIGLSFSEGEPSSAVNSLNRVLHFCRLRLPNDKEPVSDRKAKRHQPSAAAGSIRVEFPDKAVIRIGSGIDDL